MKVWKLVSGILSIVFCGVVMFQSMAAGAYNALSGNKEVSGSAGVMTAIMLLAGGIISIVIHNKEGKGGNIALLVLFGIGALTAYTLAGSYSDLYVWGTWCLICAVLALVSMIRSRKVK